jgi:hypothetical protein
MDAHHNWRTKVDVIFTELAGAERAQYLAGDVPSRVMDQIGHALRSEYKLKVAWEIGFHLGDWQESAAFLVALHLFPERFTNEEIEEGVRSLLIHVPAHIVAAARLSGHPAKDIFKVRKTKR